MADCTAGPRYCPKCGQELEMNQFICNQCGYKLDEKKIRIPYSKFEKEPRERKERTEEERKNLRIKIGLIFSIFSLLCLNSFIVLLYYPNLQFFYWLAHVNPFIFTLYMGVNGILVLFIITISALGLVYFSMKPKHRGYFLIILGYILFSFTFLTMPSLDRFSIANLPLYIIFIDVPLLTMIIFGIANILNRNKDLIPRVIAFLPIIFPIIFPFILWFYL
ncbi:MAG: hypothetical protein ACFE9Z_10865 [Promethearchaeota archaeon]